MANIKLTLAYDGTPFHGWQIQPNAVTVQAVLKKAIEAVTGGTIIHIIGAGRTDAGVHALGQVANFKTEKQLTETKWKEAINANLPDEVVVLKTEFVPDIFHARYSAEKKSYVYRIGFERSPFLFKKEWLISYPLNVPSMRKALQYLLGKHDFSSFCSKISESESKICQILEGEIFQKKDSIQIKLTADRFLTHMVRTIVGTLVCAGSGKIDPQEVEEILRKKDRTQAGKTAPPHGLYLLEVLY